LTHAVRTRLRTAGSLGLILAGLAGAARAQTVQVAPFGGYRFGGDLYEEITETPLDIDGAPCVGAALGVFVDRGLSVTFIYSHQEARVEVPLTGGATERVRLSIDQYHLGGTQEVGGSGSVRPFLLGTLGLARFGGGGDSEVRFSLGGGGGVKLLPSRHLGLRLDGRVYAVFVDGQGTGGFCAPGVCLIGLDVSVVWQAEFTAGLVVAF
jgi:hypothetical protein